MNPGLLKKLFEKMECGIGGRQHDFLCWRRFSGFLQADNRHSSAYPRYCMKCYPLLVMETKAKVLATRFCTLSARNPDQNSGTHAVLAQDKSPSFEAAIKQEVSSTFVVEVSQGRVTESEQEVAATEPKLTVIAFDIETTGFRADSDRIIEFAARDLSGGESSTISALVNPGRYVPYMITEITGITNEMVNQPHIPSWKEVGPAIVRYVESRRQGGQPLILVAHNGKRFDVPFLLKEFQSCSIEIPGWWLFLDSMPLAREAKKKYEYDWPSLKLSDIYEAYDLRTNERAHRAMADVNMLVSVLEMLVADLQLSANKFLEKSFNAEDIFASSKVFQGQDREKIAALADMRKEIIEAPWDDDKDIDSETNIDDAEVEIELEGLSIDIDMEGVSDEIISGVELPLSKSFLDTSSVDVTLLSSRLRHYIEMKRKRPRFIHLLRVGESYEAFFEDAKILSRTCKVPLNPLHDGEVEVPSASVPVSKTSFYFRLLLDKGLKLVKVDGGQSVSVMTPGMLLDDGIFDEARHTYLVSVNVSNDSWGLAFCDISTGELSATQSQSLSALMEELSRLESAEALLNSEALSVIPSNMFCSAETSSEFSPATKDSLLRPFIGKDIADTLCQWQLSDCATRALLRYVQITQNFELPIRKLILYTTGDHLCLGESARKFLEVVKSSEGKQQGSLLWAMDDTRTQMGSRLLRQWLLQPLKQLEQILLRQTVVEILVKDNTIREALRSLLSNLIDIPRVSGSFVRKCTNSWDDVVSLSEALLIIPKISLILEKLPENFYFSDVMRQQAAVMNLAEEIQGKLFEGRTSMNGAEESLQTESTDSERFIEQQVADDSTGARSSDLEQKLLKMLRKTVADSLLLLQEASHSLAALDVLCSFAETAATRDYCMPELVTDGREITIVEGRHPVVEIIKEFTPNSCYLGQRSEEELRQNLIVLTGRKGCGKSSYLQQVALIQVLAQCGCFVPAKEAKLTIADGIYTAGWCDIDGVLRKATCNSLVLLDDYGPRVGLQEAEAVSRAVIEYLASHINARSLLSMESCHFDFDGKFASNISAWHFAMSTDEKHRILPGLHQPGPPESGRFPEWIPQRVRELTLVEGISEIDDVKLEAQQTCRSTADDGDQKKQQQQNLWHTIMNLTKVATASKEAKTTISEDGNDEGDDLEVLWQQVSTVLQNSPATLALAKQKGSLLSISRGSQPAIVTIGSSAVFVRKFKQQEHAAALEAAFESLLNRPVKIQILAEQSD